jgi:hypothetical protein
MSLTTLDPSVLRRAQNQQLGMDAASISVRTAEGEFRCDVPMRSINGGASSAASSRSFLPLTDLTRTRTGSHSRVKQLYDRLGVPLIKSDFSYSFSQLLPFSPNTPSLAAASSSSLDIETTTPSSVPSTPPPPYTSAFSSRSPTPTPSKPSSSFPLRPTQRTTLLYAGSSGLSWPPLPFPSHLTTLPSQLTHLLTSLLLTFSYLLLLSLSFFYYALGLTRPAGPPSPSLGGNLRRRVRQRFSVAAEPVDRWTRRHRLPEGMRGLVRVLMAGVATVGVDEAGRMPIGEVLGAFSLSFVPLLFFHSQREGSF